MHLEDYRNYCLQKRGITESFPFGDRILVYKVAGKIFTLGDIFNFVRINVKCDPVRAIELRIEYPGVQPAWHMNKKHWNSIYIEEGFTDQQLYGWIDHSYNLVIAGLPKEAREALAVVT